MTFHPALARAAETGAAIPDPLFAGVVVLGAVVVAAIFATIATRFLF